MAQQRTRIMGLPGGRNRQRAGTVLPGVDLQNARLPLDSASLQQIAQFVYEHLLGQPTSATDTTQPTTTQTPTGQSPQIQQAPNTPASPATASTGTPLPVVPPSKGQPTQRGILQQQMELARMGQQLQGLEMLGAAQPVEIGAPIGEDVRKILGEIPRYDLGAVIENYFSEPRQQTYPLWAAVPAGSPRELVSLVREYVTTQDINAPVFRSEQNFREALLQKARQLLDAELRAARVPIDQQYQGVLDILKRQEAELLQQLQAIPPEQRVRANPHFVDLYNRYLKLQSDILNTATVAAANRNYRVNWDNLIGRAAYELARPVLDHIQRTQQLVQPHSNWIASARHALRQQYSRSGDERLRKALEILDTLERYTGRIGLSDALQAQRLNEQYETLLRSAGLEPREYRVVTPLGELPGIAYGSGPVVEPMSPLVATLQPNTLSPAQPGKVEVPMPTMGGGGGRAAERPFPIRLRSVYGAQEFQIDANKLRDELSRGQLAGLVYIPRNDVATWKDIARKVSGNDASTPTIEVGGVEFKIGADDYNAYKSKFARFVQGQLADKGVANAITHLLRQHLEFIMSNSQLPEDARSQLDTITSTLQKEFGNVSTALHEATQGDIGGLYSRFLQNLMNRLKSSGKLTPTLQKVLEEASKGGTTAYNALRAALIAAASEHIGRVYSNIKVNGREIGDSVIRPGILRLLFNNLVEMVH